MCAAPGGIGRARPLGMKTLEASFLIALAASLHVGCGKLCTEMDCSDQVTVTVLDAADVFAAELPVAVEACVGSKCAVFNVVAGEGGPTCAGPDEAPCTVEDDGDVVFDLFATAEEGAKAKIKITKQGGEVLFEDTTDVDSEEYTPNGPDCPGECRVGEAKIAARAKIP